MAGFGESLRREREMRRISLEEISETTKISIRFLDALESEEFSKLPGGIFARSFIRAYANYLGLDPDSVMAEYELVAPPKEEEDLSKLCGSNSGPRPNRSMPVLPWLLAVALLGGGYAIFRYAHRSSEGPLTFGHPVATAYAESSKRGHPAKNVPSPPVLSMSRTASGELAAASEGKPAQDPALRDKPGSRSSSSSLAPSPRAASSPSLGRTDPAGEGFSQHSSQQGVGNQQVGADPAEDGNSPAPGLNPSALSAAKTRGELVLQVAANQPSWVAVEADGKTVLEHVLAPDHVRTLFAKNFFDVTTGNAQGTILTLNGVTLKPLGRRGEVRRVHLTRDDLKKPVP
jgi:cytoskeleton protein RodZ